MWLIFFSHFFFVKYKSYFIAIAQQVALPIIIYLACCVSLLNLQNILN